jgi:uncharacterized coiled-coil DUF342 family protein
MRIKKFLEQEEVVEISNERVDEIISTMQVMNSSIEDHSKKLQSIANELMNFRSKSTTANNQIDDSNLTLEEIVSNLDDIASKLDAVVTALEDYKENGPRFLYG